MNFLAHLFLSGENENILVGNLMEDFIVGGIEHPRNAHIAPRYYDGVALHRKIDTFTDSHPCVSAAKRLVSPDFGKYASVAVDVYFDHFLALRWQEYSDKSLQTFSDWVYATFEAHWQNLPERMKPMISSMIKHNWLKNYAEMQAIGLAFEGLSKRTKYPANFEKGVPSLIQNFEELDKSFVGFFPEIVLTCQTFVANAAGNKKGQA